MLRKEIPQSALEVIDSYWNLRAAENKYVRCPYFRNPKSGRDRWGLTVYVGKGSPQDIEEEMKIVEKLEGADFSDMHEEAIRDIMKKRKLGVECSGFITHVLDAVTREAHKKPLHRLIHFKKKGLGWLLCRMRPYTHIDVGTLVEARNARAIVKINEIMPGDLIRFNTEIDHAVIITAVERDSNNSIKKINYAHSVFENSREGIKKGVVEFVNPSAGLIGQRWYEEPETGHTINGKGNPRIYRLYALKQINFPE